MDKVYILILNWNGWQDTIECLESVFRNDYPNYQVIVCDNNSQDGSVSRIMAWAEGKQLASVSTHEQIRVQASPPVAKPIAYKLYCRKDAEAGGEAADDSSRLIIIQTGHNLGFAGGNNVGLRYILKKNNFSHVWLLNNDTVIQSSALSRLMNRINEVDDAGMCGSTIPYYERPDTIWSLGGAVYNQWLARPYCIGLSQPIDRVYDRSLVERKMRYIAGASMLVSRAFLNDVGLMSEDYFLYYEELDWALRARDRFRLVYAQDSIVYHKVGASTVKNGILQDTGMTDYYMLRNALLLTYKYFPLALPIVVPRAILLYVAKRIYNYLRTVINYKRHST